jgi:DNA-binding MarR family transcriptional regulator
MSAEFDYRSLDEVFHSRIRLAIASVLASAGDAEFTYIRDAIGTTDGNLGTHIRKMEDSGYVEVRKDFRDRKPLTHFSLTEKGRRAFRAYVEHLAKFVGQ